MFSFLSSEPREWVKFTLGENSVFRAGKNDCILFIVGIIASPSGVTWLHTYFPLLIKLVYDSFYYVI